MAKLNKKHLILVMYSRFSSFALCLSKLFFSSKRIGVSSMNFPVFAIGKCYKIFRAIISWITINVVNMLFRIEKTIINLFPYKPMFCNIPTFIGKMMSVHKEQYMTLFINHPARSKFMRLFCLWPASMAAQEKPLILSSAVLRNTFRIKLWDFLTTATSAFSSWLNSLERRSFPQLTGSSFLKVPWLKANLAIFVVGFNLYYFTTTTCTKIFHWNLPFRGYYIIKLTEVQQHG